MGCKKEEKISNKYQISLSLDGEILKFDKGTCFEVDFHKYKNNLLNTNEVILGSPKNKMLKDGISRYDVKFLLMDSGVVLNSCDLKTLTGINNYSFLLFEKGSIKI